MTAPAEAPVRTPSVTLALVAAAVSGALVALQSRLNGELRQRLDDALLAAAVSFSVGLLLVGAVVLSRPDTRAALHRLAAVPVWTRLGGLGGAALVAVSAAGAPVLGVALLTVGLVAGQTLGGLLADRAGLGPGGRRPVTAPRVAGAGLGLVAVALAASGSTVRDADPVLLGLVLATGLLVAVAQALNGRVTATTGSPAVATLVNFSVGTGVLVAAAVLSAAARGLPDHAWPGPGSWPLYLGGLLGVVVIVVAATVVRVLGVLRLGLAVVAGQVLGALALDLAVPVPGARVTLLTWAGAALTLLAVAVSGRGAAPPRAKRVRSQEVIA